MVTDIRAIHEVAIIYNAVISRRSSKEQVLESVAARKRVVEHYCSGTHKAILPAEAANEKAVTVILHCCADNSDSAGSPAN